MLLKDSELEPGAECLRSRETIRRRDFRQRFRNAYPDFIAASMVSCGGEKQLFIVPNHSSKECSLVYTNQDFVVIKIGRTKCQYSPARKPPMLTNSSSNGLKLIQTGSLSIGRVRPI